MDYPIASHSNHMSRYEC